MTWWYLVVATRGVEGVSPARKQRLIVAGHQHFDVIVTFILAGINKITIKSVSACARECVHARGRMGYLRCSSLAPCTCPHPSSSTSASGEINNTSNLRGKSEES